jgi:gliding motility-associated-like protein
MIIRSILFSCFMVCSVIKVNAQEFVFASLQGETSINTEGWNLTGNAFVGNTGGTPDNFNNEIILTNPGNFQSGGIFFQEAIDLSICSNWIVEFDFRIWDGNAADGLAFCFLDVPPTGFVDGAGMGIPETANGLKVVFDTFDNCGGPNPELQIYSGVGYDECAPGIFKLENTTGQLAFIRNNQYRSARITYDNGLVELFINDVFYLGGFAPADFEGFMGFTASTGGFNDRHSIKNVTIYTLSAESEAGDDVTICSGQNIEIGSEPNADYAYVWSPAGHLSDINIANPEFSFENNTDQIQTFTYFVTTSIAENPGVCETQDSIVINVLPNISVTFNSPSQVCANSEASFSQSIENAPENLNFLWTFEQGEPNQSTDASPSGVTWSSAGTFTISLEASLGECILPPFTQQIQVFDSLIADFTFQESACEGDEVQFQFNSENTDDFSLTWTFEGGMPSSVENDLNPTVSFDNAGVFEITAAVENDNCNAVNTQTLQVNAFVASEISGPDWACQADEAIFNGNQNAPSNANFNWFFLSGEPNAATTFGSASTVWNNEGEFYAILSIENEGCIGENDTLFVQVRPKPDAVISGDTQVCAFTHLTLSYDGSFEVSLLDFNWLVSDNGIISNTEPGIINVFWQESGNKTVSLTSQLNGCSSNQENLTITVFESPEASFVGPSLLCVNQSGNFQFTGNVGNAATYQWTFDGATLGSAQTQGPHNVIWEEPGNFEVSLLITENGCESEPFSSTVLVEPGVIPVADFIGINTSGCIPFTAEVLNNSESFGESVQLQWFLNDLSVGSSENLNLTIQESGNYNLKLVVTTTTGCQGSDTLEISNFIEGFPIPNAQILVEPSDRLDISNPIFNLSTEEEQHFCTFQLPNDVVFACQTQFVAPETGIFPVGVIVENEFGCIAESFIDLAVTGVLIYIPNAFSPNGDGVNEIFKPVVKGARSFSFQVFNRWGAKIFETNNANEGWAGEEVPQNGIYVYKLSVTDFLGNITLKNGTIQVVK